MIPAPSHPLVQSRIVRDYEAAISELTGLQVRLTNTAASAQDAVSAELDNEFCDTLTRGSKGCEACLKTQEVVQGRVTKLKLPHEFRCFAGLMEVAVPVLVDKKHVATLFGGRVFLRKPTPRDFKPVAARLIQEGFSPDLDRLEKVYLRTRVLTAGQFKGFVRLLAIFAKHLSAEAARNGLARRRADPPPVASAKEFAHARAAERISTRDAARHVNLSAVYFCKVFKSATGMTFTEFLNRIRVEKAKKLLLDPFARVTEVAYASGFRAIPHFNSVFKKCAGLSPTAWRQAQRRELSA